MFDVVDRTQRERHYAAMRATAERERRVVAGAERTRAIRHAERAVEACGLTVSAEQRLYCSAFTDLALASPTIGVTWLIPGSRAADLTPGIFLRKQGAIATPALVNAVEFAGSLHELGHARDPWFMRRRTIAREVFAWNWAIGAAVAWIRPMHDELCRCLPTYLRSATQSDVIDVAAAEVLMSDTTFARHHRPLAPSIAAFERREFLKAHGVQRCAACNDDATCLDGDGRLLCSVCLHRARRRQRSA